MERITCFKMKCHRQQGLRLFLPSFSLYIFTFLFVIPTLGSFFKLRALRLNYDNWARATGGG
jgi:hypothetical protein